MQFWGYDKCSKSKMDAGKFNRSELKSIDYPCANNACIWMGKNDFYEEKYGSQAHVIGIDLDIDKTWGGVNIDDILPFFPPTLTEKTGSGGVHLYYIIYTPSIPKGSEDGLTPITELQSLGIKQIDCKYNNQIFFCANTKFDEHPNPYQIYVLRDMEVFSTWGSFREMLEKVTQKTSDPSPSSSGSKGGDIPLGGSHSAQLLMLFEPFFTDGNRHQMSLWIAEICYLYNIDQLSVEKVITDLMRRTGDTEDEDRMKCVESAYTVGYKAKLALVECEKRMGKRNWQKVLKILESESKLFDKAKKEVLRAHADEDEDWLEDLADQILKTDQHIGFEENLKKMYYWKGQYYQLQDLDVQGFIADAIRSDNKRVANIHNMNEIYKQITIKNHHESIEFDNNDGYVVLKNGLFDVSVRQLLPPEPQYLALMHYDVEYLPDVTIMPPKFQLFIQSLTPNPDEQVRICQILRDMLLNQFLTMKKFLVTTGVTNAGKGVIARLLTRIIGNANVIQYNLKHLGNQFSGGDLLHARLAMDSDSVPDELSSTAVSFIKKMCGLDIIRMERKGKDAICLPNHASFLLASNKIPKLPPGDESKSITAKAVFIRFNTTYEVQPDYEEKLHEEADQIFSYLVNPSNLPLTAYPPTPTGATVSASEYWRLESDPVYRIAKEVFQSLSSECVVTKTDVMEVFLSRLQTLGFFSYQEKVLWEEIQCEIRRIGGRFVYKQKDNTRYTLIAKITCDECPLYTISEFESEKKKKD